MAKDEISSSHRIVAATTLSGIKLMNFGEMASSEIRNTKIIQQKFLQTFDMGT